MKVLRYIVISVAILILLFSAGYYLADYYHNNGSNIKSEIPATSDTISEIETIKYSLEEPPSESLRGQIATMSGEIHWQSRTATESSKLSDIQKVLQGETYSTKEESGLFFVFENVCAIDMSENTQVEIVQTLPTNLVFKQTSGDVSYTKIGENPVSIRALSLLIDIGGNTAISVDSEQNIIRVKVRSYTATVAYNDLDYISHQLEISDGQTYTFNHDTRKGVVR